ncbi:MAG: GNAT family N-acetyltransferase [Streptococcaceae bacterium]|jgi:N-acetylglutamate synthase-like GNAT family acetyltransferase|nr:GNAT family N-acetyltransferase [Streptococcaceae bacterium]
MRKNLKFITTDEQIDYEDVKILLHSYELTDLPVDKIKLAFQNSRYKVFIVDENNRVLGCGRALSDGVAHAEIYNIALNEKLHHQGLGGKMIQNLLKQAEGQIVTLYTAPWTTTWYESQGFKPLKTAMVRFREHELDWMVENQFI